MLKSVSAVFSRHRSSAFALFFSGFSQIISSATNFLLGIYLVRAMSAEDFGVYSISFATTISCASFANSVFLVPMTISLPQNSAVDRDRFLADNIVILAILSIGSALVIPTFVVLLVIMAGSASGSLILSVGATALSCVGFLLKDAVVQAGYNQRREYSAIVINGIAGLGVLMSILYWWINVKELESTTAIIIYAVCQLAAAIIGYFFLFNGVPVSGMDRLIYRARTVLANGFWPAITSGLYLLRTQAHTIISTILLGPAAVALINASRLMFSPIQMLTPAIIRAAMPRLVRLRHHNATRYSKYSFLMIFALFFISVVYGVICVYFGSDIFFMIAGSKYEYNLLLILSWAGFIAILSARSAAEAAQLALGHFRAIAKLTVIASIVAIFATFGLTRFFGPAGSVLGVALGEALAAFFLLRQLKTSI